MDKGISKKIMAWILTIAMLLTATIVPSFAAGAERSVDDLEDFVLIIKQDGKEIDEGEEIRFEDPFEVSLKFKVPEGSNGVLFETDDYIKFPMPGIKDSGTPTMKLKGTDIVTSLEIDVAEAKFVSGELIITFDNDVVFGSTSDYYEVECTLEAEFQYAGADINDGDKVTDIVVLGKKFTFIPTVPGFTITKSGVQDGSEIEWEVKVKSEKEFTPPKPSEPGSLKGIVFKDELAGVGEYVANSISVAGTEFTGTGDAIAGFGFDSTGKHISFEFPDDATGEYTIKFRTEVPINTLINGGSVNNTGKIYDGDPDLGAQLDTDSEIVPITAPIWIKKDGVINLNQNADPYVSGGREITWTITINEAAAALKQVKIIDAIPSGLTWVSASWKEEIGGVWGPTNTIGLPADGKTYSIGDINGKVELTIVTSIPDEDYVLSSKTFTNTARIESDEITGQNADKGIGVGYSAFTKDGTSDIKEGTVEWTLDLDPRGQALTDIFIYDLFVYGDTNIINLDGLSHDAIPLFGDSGGPAFPSVQLSTLNLTQNKNMKFKGDYSNPVGHTNTKYSVYTLRDSSSNAVADLLIIDVYDNSKHSFKFKTKITDPKIYASNTASNYTVPNTANLRFKYGGSPKEFNATRNAPYVSNVITKETLSRNWTTPNNKGTATNSFDYIDKSVVYRILVNKNDMNLTDPVISGGQGLSAADITLKDTLPLGWEFKVMDGADFVLYKADSSGNYSGSPIIPPGIVSMAKTTGTSTTSESAVFTFTELKGSYIILLKAGPTEDSAKDFFKGNKTATGFENTVEFLLDNDKLADSKNTINITSTMFSKELDKSFADTEGYLIWTIDYNPYDIDPDIGIDELAIVDTLDPGLDFITDSEGKLIIAGDNVKAYKMKLKNDGTLTEVSNITLTLDDNIFYDMGTRELKFIIEDHDVPHRLVYITDITGSPGEDLGNKAMLTLKGVKHEGDTGGYTVSSDAATATLKRGGNMTITKVQGDGTTPFAGVEFKLFSSPGGIVIREGKTDTSGNLTFKAIPEGNYTMTETVPSGYRDESRVYTVKVETIGVDVITSIDGKTGDDSDKITIANYADNTVGDLKVMKTVSGIGGSSALAFNFTITVGNITGDYDCIDQDGNYSTIKFTSGKAVVSLKGDESIIIKNLPKGLSYSVVEDDYISIGYFTEKSNDTGSIAEDALITVSFTNKKDGWVKITKVDAADGTKFLPGAEFTLYGADKSTVVKTGDTDGNGELWLLNIDPGTYYIKETKAPVVGNGYDKQLEEVFYEVIVDGSGGTTVNGGLNEITVENYENDTVGDL